MFMNLGEKRKYGAIYADLRWYFRNWSASASSPASMVQGRIAERFLQ